MASAEDRLEELGPWKDANLRATANADAGIGSDAGLPTSVRFQSMIAKLVRRHRALVNSAGAAVRPAIFLLMPSPPISAAPHQPKRIPRLDEGVETLSGRLWFVGAAPGSGAFVPAEFDDDDALFEFVTDTLGLANAQAILYDPAHPTPHLRHYVNGLADLSAFQDLSLDNAEVTIETVTQIIDNTHAQKMITPDAQPKAMGLWFDRDKWRPHRNAEDRVQGYLEIALNAAFPTCIIRAEESLPEGRLDIEIIENDPTDRSRITQHGVLELKILRSYGETGKRVTKQETLDWIKSGVEQAFAYRDSASKGALWSALLCFDMRVEDVGDAKCFSHVRKLAASLDVHLRRWFLYATSKQIRTARAAAKVKAGAGA